MAVVTSITVTVGFTSAFEYQSAKAEESRTVTIQEGEDPDAVRDEVRRAMAKSCSDYVQIGLDFRLDKLKEIEAARKAA